ncbi:MAG TPA: chain length determinant protein EpsF [Burkholderiaceae bacterium]|nr:chain length determinant protein EpsF [Burkholderiaceae bacterium]
MSLGQFISILLARWKIVLAVFVLTVGSVVAVSLLLPKKYTATASVVVDLRSPDPLVGMVLGGTPSYANTQLQIVQSERVALRVVRNLKLADNPQTREQWREATGGQGNIETWLARALLRSVTAKPAGESNVIEVQYESVDPKFSALMANAFVQAYIETHLDLRADPAKRFSTFFDQRAKQLREQLEAAQNRLSEYQREHGLIATDERLDIENARLAELSSQLVAIQAIATDSSSREAQARSAGDRMQEVLLNPLISGLKADLNRQEVRLQELSERYGRNHPQVVEAQASVQALRARIASETQRVTSSVTVTNNINRQREAELKAALEAQRAKVLKMKEQRDQAAVLLRDVENAQRAYDTVLARLNQTNMESESTATNVSVLSPAMEPSSPSSPKVVLNTLVAICAGGVLAFGAAFLIELLDRRVRSFEDAFQLLGLPVIGIMPRPVRSRLPFRRSVPSIPGRVLGQLPGPRGA